MNKDEWVDSVELREVSDLMISAHAMGPQPVKAHWTRGHRHAQ